MKIRYETDIDKWRQKLNEEIVPIAQAKQPRNLISNWMNTGVINDKRKGDGKRRYLSYIDFFWVCIVIKLRAIGYHNDQIKKARELIFKPIKSDFVEGELPVLEEAVLQITTQGEPLYLELSEYGDASIFNEETYRYGARAGFYTCFVMIRLNRLFKEQIKSILFRTEFINYEQLSNDEQKVLNAIKSEETQSITITKKNNQIEFIEVEQDIMVDKRVVDILKEQDYQTIEIKQHNGKVTKIRRTIKHKGVTNFTLNKAQSKNQNEVEKKNHSNKS